MNREQLQSLLQQLRQGLADAPPMDSELRASLLQLEDDIQHALKPQAAAANEGADGNLEDRAKALEARFEAEHPVLAGTIRDLMDTLGKMGI
ncbi:MAG: hypothetical protein RI907_3952 [Pseudomonadota bacterium]|jgi:hypothetical protein